MPPEPKTAESRLAAAAALEAAGSDAEARETCLGILADTPDHPDTLIQLGALLFRTGYRGAARSAFARVAARHPRRPDGHVNLAHLLREDGQTEAAMRHYQAALRRAPDLPEAHQGLASALFEAGDAEQAEAHCRLGYRDRVFSTWPYRGHEPPVRVLMLASVRGGNIAATPLLDTRIFAVTVAAMEFLPASLKPPPHDVVFNAIGDADLCREALLAARTLAARNAAPVVNRPDAVAATGRESNARRLAALPGVRVPRMQTWRRADLLAPDAPAALVRAGFVWPLLLRAPGFHTGRHFVRVDAPARLAHAVASVPGEDLLVIAYAAPEAADGMARKCRVMCVGGVLYPLHLAISPDWKVHYFTAAMADSAAYRAEEAVFLTDMPAYLGPRAMAGLQAIFDTLGLDYAGADICRAADGSVVLFEANAAMALVPPTPDPIWDYRRAPIERVRQATIQMLRRHAAAGKSRS